MTENPKGRNHGSDAPLTFEVIDVDGDHPDRIAGFPALAQHAAQAVGQATTVAKAGQRVD